MLSMLSILSMLSVVSIVSRVSIDIIFMLVYSVYRLSIYTPYSCVDTLTEPQFAIRNVLATATRNVLTRSLPVPILKRVHCSIPSNSNCII